MKASCVRFRWILLLALTLAMGAVTVPTQAFALWGLTTRVSLNSAAAQGNGGSRYPVLSSNGRYVVFESSANNLVLDDTNFSWDVFLRDRTTGVTTRVSLSSSGAQGSDFSRLGAISSDGRYVTFSSAASNLVTGDTNGTEDVFVRDRITGVTSRVNVSAAGVQADDSAIVWSISADGRFVVFSSAATNLVANDTNGAYDVFVRDRVANTTARVSVSSANVQGNAAAFHASISADGRYVAFESDATNLVANDTNGNTDVFVRDRVANATTRVSVSSSGAQAGQGGTVPMISGNGRYVAFESMAGDLTSNDTNGNFDVFVHDRVTGATTRESASSSGAEVGSSRSITISGDGRRVAFESNRPDLVSGDTNSVVDIFLRDRATGVTTRESLSSAGVQGNALSRNPFVSGDGRYVAFWSSASNLVADDLYGYDDVFVREAPAMTTSISIKTAATSATSGKTVTLSGAVAPAGVIGWNIVAYVKKPGKTYWTYSSNRTVYNLGGNAAWQYKYYFKPGMVKGVYVFKAVVPAWPGFLTSTSPTTVSIRLK